MSIKVMTRVWDQSGQSGSNLLVLLALADHADDDGVCWPGLDRVARKARIVTRQAKRLVKALAEDGEIYIESQQGQSGGRGYTNNYFVVIGVPKPEIERILIHRFEISPLEARAEAASMIEKQERAAQKREAKKGDIQGKKGDIYVTQKRVTSEVKRVTSEVKRVTSEVKKGDIAMSPEPSIEPSIEPSGRGSQPRENRVVEKPHPTPPPIKIYTELTGITPARALWKRTADSVGEDEAGLKRWRETIAGWLGTGWKAGNIIGMLEYFERGEIPSTGNGRKANDEGSRYKKPKITDEIKETYTKLANQTGGFNPT